MGLACNYREHMPLPQGLWLGRGGAIPPGQATGSGAPVSPVKQTLPQGKAWLEAPLGLPQPAHGRTGQPPALGGR